MPGKKQARLILSLLAALGLLAIACDAPPPTEGISPLTPPQSEGPTAPSVEPEGRDPEIVSLVKQDLADRLAIAPDDIEIIEITLVEWPDASLGCPAEGQMYAQVVTAGQQIKLWANEQTFTYHTGPDTFVLCTNEDAGLETQPGEAAVGDIDLDAEVAPLVEEALQDLSARLGISLDGISLASAEAVQWRDSSLGCPVPGRSYLSVITPGYLVRLRVDDKTYEYHTDSKHVVYCQDPQSTETVGDDPAVFRAIEMVTADLAERLGIPRAEIRVTALRAVNWPSTGLGCPQPGMSYADVITPGYAITLAAGGNKYLYHTGADSFILCPDKSEEEAGATVSPTEEPILDPTLARRVQEAKVDLSVRLGIPVDSIALTSAQEVDWRDSSLGCPEVGMAYLTVITPGYLILLEAEGQVYEYHADSRHVVTCENPQPPLDG